MADSINKYASEAEYNSASHGSTPEVSKVIGSVSPVRYDGRNTDTTGSPSVGDAVYLDPDDNVRFISWKNFAVSSMPSGWTPVGVVVNRLGRTARILYKNYVPGGFIACEQYMLTNPTGSSIQFKVKTASASQYITLSDMFTPTASWSNGEQWTAELNTWLKAHQPDENGRGGAKYTWHAKYIGGKVMLLCDTKVLSNSCPITATGITCTVYKYALRLDAIPYTYSGELQRANTGNGVRNTVFPERVIAGYGQYTITNPTSQVSVINGSDYVSRAVFEENQYCSNLRDKYGTYESYIYSTILGPYVRGGQTGYTVSNALRNTQILASITYPNINDEPTPYYQVDYNCQYPGTETINSKFSWYKAGIFEVFEYLRYRQHSDNDPVFKTLFQLSSNMNTLAKTCDYLITDLRVSNCAWRLYNQGQLSYAGGTYDLPGGNGALAMADYDLTGRT